MRKRVLVVDDEALIREFIQSFFEGTPEFSECKVDVAVNGEEAIARIREKTYDLIFTDLKMPGKSGLDVIKFASEHSPTTDTVLLTAYAGGESAAKAMAYGAYEYITKPVPIDELEMIVRHIFERRELIEENRDLKQQLRQKISYPKIIGRSKKIMDIMEVVKMVAPTNSTILITGESGTGKELIAQAIHDLSPRKDKNFVRINCAAIPEQLIESELFGFEKGSFTGAIKRTRGKFEMAHEGSILLDEISEMNLDLQAKLLRVIQEKELTRIGSETPVKVNARVIATSNRDLSAEVEKGNFREDLFFRLNIVPIHLPPLCERPEDVPLLADHFTKKLCFEHGIAKKVITPEVTELLVTYKWPGNIRELQNAIERAIITNPGDILDLKAFHFMDVKPAAKVSASPLGGLDGKSMAEVEKMMIFNTLEKTNNNRTEAATILGITTRTLRNKLHQYAQEDQ